MSGNMDDHINKSDFQQNVGKMEVVPALRSGWHNQKAAELAVGKWKMSPDVRHLGGRYVWNGNNRQEMRQRVLAAKKGWASMGRFWRCSCPFRVRRLIFQTKVVAPMCAGMESYMLSKKDLGVMNTFMVKRLKVMMRGKAKDERSRSWSVGTFLAAWRLVPFGVEMAVRRLKWLQAMVYDSEAHEKIIATTWGKRPGDETGVVDEAGKLTGEATPLAKAIEADMTMAEMMGMRETTFFDWWEQEGKSWRSIFLVEDIRDAFLKLDFTELRAMWLQRQRGGRGATTGGGRTRRAGSGGPGRKMGLRLEEGGRRGL